MDDRRLTELGSWITEEGLAGRDEAALLVEFCRKARESGLPVIRASVIIDTLHPIHEGRAFRWHANQAETASVVEYGRSTEGEVAASWRRSPFYHLVETGKRRLRRNLAAGEPPDFPSIEELKADGMTDYVAFINRFAAEGAIGEMDCVYSSWATDAPDGFGERGLAALDRLVPTLALALKCASLARIAATLVEVYLGRDAGRRVLSGRIARGVADRIGAVLWYSDLRGYTRITDTAPPDQVIPLLNDYADAVVSAVYEQGGDVLKLIGDGILAIFQAENPARACGCALEAAADLRRRVGELNRRRDALELPTTHPYLALHVGEVFYGNVGSEDRLDFTVIGPAVNEVSRIAAMCRSAERDVLLSSAFVAAVPEPARASLVSVGRYALRGIERPQELFTLLGKAAQ